MSVQNISIVVTIALIAIVAALSYQVDVHLRATTLVTDVDLAGARDALNRLSEWSRWMAGIQTATLAALGLLTKDRPGAYNSPAAVGTVLFMGTALFCSAWILSSLPSIALRISSPKVLLKDVYEYPLYGWTGPHLSYVVSLQHWLWAVGLLSFAWFLLELRSVSVIGSAGTR